MENTENKLTKSEDLGRWAGFWMQDEEALEKRVKRLKKWGVFNKEEFIRGFTAGAEKIITLLIENLEYEEKERNA